MSKPNSSRQVNEEPAQLGAACRRSKERPRGNFFDKDSKARHERQYVIGKAGENKITYVYVRP